MDLIAANKEGTEEGTVSPGWGWEPTGSGEVGFQRKAKLRLWQVEPVLVSWAGRSDTGSCSQSAAEVLDV